MIQHLICNLITYFQIMTISCHCAYATLPDFISITSKSCKSRKARPEDPVDLDIEIYTDYIPEIVTWRHQSQ